MANEKIVVVFGATGNQGGSVIKSILSDPKTANEFKIRGITRDPSKPNAKALEAKGVETVAGDINSKDDIRAALKGAYAVFAVTNYWEKMDEALEEQQGRNIADLSKEAGVHHLIWSSLLNIADLTSGTYPHVYHFDSKARVEAYIRSLSIAATFFLPGFFMSNFESSIHPSPTNNGTYTLSLPMPGDTPIPAFDAATDTGIFVKNILTHREQLLGKRVLAATDYYTPEQVMSTFREVYPKAGDAAFVQCGKEEYMGMLRGAGMPEKAQVEMWENMAFMHDYGYYGKADLKDSLAILDGKTSTVKDFFAKSKMFDELR
ncbi:MAG: hypothetical protein Q9174_004577 [Haloplaca sp. 1 TL-2023]